MANRIAEIRANNDGTLPTYAWPGGYPLYYLCADGGELCPKCANRENGSEAIETTDDPQWKLIGCEIHYEGEPIDCAHCNAKIEPAYTED